MKKSGHVKASFFNGAIPLVVWLTVLYLPGFVSCRDSAVHFENGIEKVEAPSGKGVVIKIPERLKKDLLNTKPPPRVTNVGNPEVRSAEGEESPFFINYGISQGLPVNSILCSAFDKMGNLWLGTAGDGVCRYDGSSCANYTIAQGLASNVVFSILQSSDANLWFATSGGLTRYDGYRFVTFTTKDGLPGNFISSLAEDTRGNLWVGTSEGGLARYDGKSFTNFTTSQGLPDNYIRCLLKAQDGTLWIGTATGGLSNYDGHQFKNYSVKDGLADNAVTNMMQGHDGDIWVSSQSGISKWDGKSFTVYSLGQKFSENKINCAEEDDEGNIWIGTSNKGVLKFNGREVVSYNIIQGGREGNITSIRNDEKGNLWFTTWGNGVFRYKANGLSAVHLPEGLSADDVFGINRDLTGNLWLGLKEHGLMEYGEKLFRSFTSRQGLPDDAIWTVMPGRKGNLWIGTDKAGLVKFDGAKFTNYTVAQGLAGNTVSALMEDSKGRIWVGTFEGVSVFDGVGFTSYTSDQGLAGNNVLSLLESVNGDIWIATHDNGVSKFDGTSFHNYSVVQGLASNTVYAAIGDKNGGVWFGTSRGLSFFDGRKFENYTTSQGLPDNYVWALAEDKVSGRIWVGTNNGISLLRRIYSDDKGAEVSFENFNEGNGYPVREVNTGALFVDSLGVLWIGSRDHGLIRFDYNLVGKLPGNPPELVIKSVKVNEKNVCWHNLSIMDVREDKEDSLARVNEMVSVFGEVLEESVLDSMRDEHKTIRFDSIGRFYPVPHNLVLPYNENTVTISFAAVDPAAAQQMKYQYLLEGYSNDWSQLSNNTVTVLGNIPPGKYLFKLKALSPSGVWSQASYAFTIRAPWWLTWWAYLLCGLLLGAIFFFFYRNHIRALERRQEKRINLMVATQEEERRRIARDLHDEVGVKLSALRLSLSSLSEKLKAEEKGQAEAIARQSDSLVGEAMQDVRRLLVNLSPRILEEFGLIPAVEAIVTRIKETSPIQIHFSTFGTVERMNHDFELSLYRMVQELINNVIKHADAKEVSLQLGMRDEKIVLMIEDDGIGFDAGKQVEGHGLQNLKVRTQLMKGTIAIDSHPGKGTSISIEIPYNQKRK